MDKSVLLCYPTLCFFRVSTLVTQHTYDATSTRVVQLYSGHAIKQFIIRTKNDKNKARRVGRFRWILRYKMCKHRE